MNPGNGPIQLPLVDLMEISSSILGQSHTLTRPQDHANMTQFNATPTRLLAPRASRTPIAGADIPTSTVAAIGGGFVAFAIFLLGGLTSIRMLRIWKEARKKRRQGEQVTFRQLWSRQGGFWGFVTGYGSDMTIVGAGGRSDRAFLTGWGRWEMELERHMRAEMLAGKEAHQVPKMNEVMVPKAGGEGVHEFCPGQDQVSG